jgi:hypothetical protein
MINSDKKLDLRDTMNPGHIVNPTCLTSLEERAVSTPYRRESARKQMIRSKRTLIRGLLMHGEKRI